MRNEVGSEPRACTGWGNGTGSDSRAPTGCGTRPGASREPKPDSERCGGRLAGEPRPGRAPATEHAGFGGGPVSVGVSDSGGHGPRRVPRQRDHVHRAPRERARSTDGMRREAVDSGPGLPMRHVPRGRLRHRPAMREVVLRGGPRGARLRGPLHRRDHAKLARGMASDSTTGRAGRPGPHGRPAIDVSQRGGRGAVLPGAVMCFT